MNTTLQSYDEIPYNSRPIELTHPQALAARARALGWQPPALEGARVLELGAASGGNLIPLAFYLPHTHFVGVDLSRAQVEDGQKPIASLGLKNIELCHANILDLSPDPDRDALGHFDYIIVHGVYSWVPPVVQERILSLCAERLSPNGLACISYNVLPGFRVRQMTRDLLLERIDKNLPPRERLQQARALIERMHALTLNGTSLTAQALHEDLAHLLTVRDSYLYHEYLEETNEALSFAQFSQRITHYGLEFVAETDLSGSYFIEEMSDHPRLTLEMDEDIRRGRPFRQSLLTRQTAPRKTMDNASRVRSLIWQAGLQAVNGDEIELATDSAFAVRELRSGRHYEVTHPLVKAALALLINHGPAGLPGGELIEAACGLVRQYGHAREADKPALLADALLRLWQNGALNAAVVDSPPVQAHWARSAVPERPKAHALARLQAQSGAGYACACAHLPVELDGFSTALLLALNGQQDRAALKAGLLAHLRQMPALRKELGLDGMSTAALSGLVEQNMRRLLETFAREGLLEPD